MLFSDAIVEAVRAGLHVENVSDFQTGAHANMCCEHAFGDQRRKVVVRDAPEVTRRALVVCWVGSFHAALNSGTGGGPDADVEAAVEGECGDLIAVERGGEGRGRSGLLGDIARLGLSRL